MTFEAETPTDRPTGTRHRVLLIRPWDMPDGVGAGCCGGGSTKGLCVDPEHHPSRGGTRNIERVGWAPFAAVYRMLRDQLPGNVAVEIVDPRNHLYLLPVLTAEARRGGAGWWAALRAAVRAPAYAAIIVDGRTVSSGELPAPEDAVRAVRSALAEEHV